MEVDIDFYRCKAWANVLNCSAQLSIEYCDFDKFVVPYISPKSCGLTVKPGTKVNCFPIVYAVAVTSWAAEHNQKLRLFAIDNKVVLEFV